MLETRAIVVKIDGQHALVRADQANGCELCSGRGCAADKLFQLLCSKPRQFQVNNPINANVGDEVIVSVAEGAVMRGIGLVYLLPLVFLVTGAMLTSVWVQQPGQSDSYAAVGALFGLVLGFVVAKWISLRKVWSDFKPFISRQLGEVVQAKGELKIAGTVGEL
jgi:sigma-E factor negative regulatory protein RseC